MSFRSSGLRNKLRNWNCFGRRYQLALRTLSHISIIISVLRIKLIRFSPTIIAVGLGVPLVKNRCYRRKSANNINAVKAQNKQLKCRREKARCCIWFRKVSMHNTSQNSRSVVTLLISRLRCMFTSYWILFYPILTSKVQDHRILI